MLRTRLLSLPFALLLAVGPVQAQQIAATAMKLTYPAANRVEQVDNYHGTKVSDPYRWLEDPDSPETKAWVEAENKLTFGYLETIPARQGIKDRLTKVWNYERSTVPFRKGGRYFFSRNTGLQNQNILYTVSRVGADPRLLLDPNKLSSDGTVALSTYAVSDDGKWLTYALASSGSDWLEWHVRNIATGEDRSEVLKWSKFSNASWTKDNRGFFYSRYDKPQSATQFKDVNYFQKLYYHRLGTAQSEDALIYERRDQKEWIFEGEVSEDGRYLVITITQGTEHKNRVFYKDLRSTGAGVVELLPKLDAAYTFVGNDGPLFWFLTDKNAPRGRLIAIDTRTPDKRREVIPQVPQTLEQVSLVGDRFIARYLKDAHSQIKIFALSGKLAEEVALPGIGTAEGFTGKRRDTETFYSYTSYTTPTSIYRYDLKTGRSSPLFQPRVDFNPEDYTTEQVFYTSKDGTRVPMFITYKKGLKRDGTTPTLLYGYGGFNISITPSFSPARLVWLEMGGVYAVPNLRGGGEYGEDWHQAGMKLKKQNVFDDFIAAGEWLVTHRITSTPKLAISGASNGGLLVGAALTQRPDLFGAALPAVGVMDMLRFQKFTIGWAWTSDYGSSDNPEEFRALYAYSPLQNLKPGTAYPATLITTADHDDRVVPAHSFKFAATLQAAQTGIAPVLIRIETKAGHGAGKPTTKVIEEAADSIAFLTRALKMPSSP